MSSKIFFSYSRFDSPFALKLAKDLREAGANVWIDQLDIQAGNHWDSAVEKALDNAATVLVILSPTSIVSPNVMDEVSFALDTGKRIIPVLFVDCVVPFRLRRLQRVDFTYDYGVGLNQLMQSLKLNSPQEVRKEQLHASGVTAEPTAEDVLEDVEWESNLWEEACTTNTIAGYKKYISESVSGEYKSEARLLIKQIELEQKEDELEALLWQKAKSKNVINLYQHYLQQYPQGNYKTLALAAIADLEPSDKSSVSLVDMKANEELAQVHSNRTNKHRLQLIAIIGLIISVSFVIGIYGFSKINAGNEEQEAWMIALTQNDSVGFQTYIKQFPNGTYLASARKKLDSLNMKQSQQQESMQASVIAGILSDSIAKSPVVVLPDSTTKQVITPKTKTPIPSKPVSKFKLGQKHEGGIIVYISASGDHGLIAATKDEGAHTWDIAKRKCDSYKSEGYIDWRLPSKDELKKMYTARKYLGAYTKGIYWSFTEENKETAWVQNFITGSQGNSSKQSTLAVRAVRTF